MSECTQERFLRDVAEHQIKVIRDDGVNRHIRFQQPGTSCYHFDLITWPGSLCYTGDMGTFVFRRTHDMFEFFGANGRYGKNPETLYINPGYWDEKIIANNIHGGHKEFDEDKFRKRINNFRVNWMRQLKEAGSTKEARRELWEAVEDEVLDTINDGKDRAQIAAYDFHHKLDGDEFYFQDLFEYNFTRHTFGFIWCCYALAWGIKQYNLHKSTQATQAVG